jgi:type II secretory pathway predicted ATPase ExeA
MNNSEIKYNNFFGFSELPFQRELGQKSPFIAKQHEALLTDLVKFIIARQGVALLQGDSGVGKTVLVHALVQRIPKNFHPLVINGPAAHPLALTIGIAHGMAINLRDGNLLHLNRLADAVRTAASHGKFYIVLLDNAHELTDQHLEEIWVLSQMELNGNHLLSFILGAQPTLSQRLGGQTDQHLAKLIDQKFNLVGLTSDETLLYIDHRLHQVGSSFQACFAEDCTNQLFALTGGNPRQINTICHQALERCWHENLPRVTAEILAGKGQAPIPKDHGPTTKKSFRKIVAAMAAGVALVVGLAAYTIYTILPGKMSLASKVISETLATDGLNPAQEQAPTAPDSPTSPTSPEPAYIKAGRQPVLPKPESLPPPEQQASKELSGAEALPAPQTNIRPKKMTRSTPISYRVTAKDHNLRKIVAAHYPKNKKYGFVAIILANPQITAEDLIYSGQIITLPEVNNSNNIIKLNDSKYYLLYNRYSNVSKFNKALSKLKKLKIRYLTRETQHSTAGKIYRIYLGGYETEEDINKILTLVEEK